MRSVEVSDALYDRLVKMAGPLFKPGDVVERLVDAFEANEGDNRDRPSLIPAPARISDRAPRERGGIVEVNGQRIIAVSVRDLYQQVLELIDKAGLWDRLLELVPYRTSGERYLLSKTPKHPTDREFFVPVKHRNLYMEAHKNYNLAIRQLETLLAKCDIEFKYLGAA